MNALGNDAASIHETSAGTGMMRQRIGKDVLRLAFPAVAHDTVAFAPASDVAADCGDFAGELDADRHRVAGALVLGLRDLAAVEAGGAHAHQHLTGADDRAWRCPGLRCARHRDAE